MIHVVTGPPCAGKSTYVRTKAKAGDLRIDYDQLARALGAENSHAAEGLIKQAAFDAREGAIAAALKQSDAESWIIHTSPSKEHIEKYEAAGAEFINLDPGYEECMARAEKDDRPQQTIDAIEKWYSGKKGRTNMNLKKKTIELKAENGTISGYAATWTREPDSYGDVIVKGAFAECLAKIKAEGKVIPLLYNHDSYNLNNFIGTITSLEEDDHGLKFDGVFDDTKEAQRARELALDGRLCKFSFSYDVLDQAQIEIDGRQVNELRKLNIHEVSLVMYPANPDTSVLSVKSGRRNSAKDTKIIKEAISLLQELLGELDDIGEPLDDSKAKSKEPDPVNDEERERREKLLKEAETLLKMED